MNLLVVLTSILLLVPGSEHLQNGDKPIKLPKYVKQNFVIVPEGAAFLDGVKIPTGQFYLATQEVSNIYYAEYLAYLKTNSLEMEIKEAAIHTDKWSIEGAFMEPFKEHYHQHPAYHDYPVVNISREAAEGYCSWLEGIYNQQMEAGYHVELRLPTRAEWVRAAQNGQQSNYSWGGQYLRNAKGCMLCNFRNVGAENVGANPETGELEVRVDRAAPLDNAAITAPCSSYLPSALGLYNMNGNVAEMVADQNIAVGGSWNSPGYDVRNESVMAFDEPSPFVGFRPIMHVIKD